MAFRPIASVDPHPTHLRSLRMGLDSEHPRGNHPVDTATERNDLLHSEAEGGEVSGD